MEGLQRARLSVRLMQIGELVTPVPHPAPEDPMAPTLRRVISVTAGLALSVGAFACFSADRIARPDAHRIKVAPDALRDDISDINGYVRACKKGGPAGTYSFHLDVQGGGDLTMLNQDLTLTFDGTNMVCQTMMYPLNPESWIGEPATVSVTEVQIPAGTVVDSIEVYSSSGNGWEPTVIGTPTVTHSFTFGDMYWFKYYNSAAPLVCTDPLATNLGGPLPCQYPPPPTCLDPAATNVGGPLPCQYPPPPPPPPTPCPGGSFTYSFNAAGDLLIKYDQFPAPNDNSYGKNSIGWNPKRPHRFSDLVNSDHAGIMLLDGTGKVRLSFNVDYLTAKAGTPSGYASLGVSGGDGKMIVGTATGITATTSLANNLNNINIPGLFNAAHVQQFGSVNVLVNSPPTDPAHLTYVISDPALAGWDFRNTYYVTVSAAKLAGLGFNAATWKVLPNADQLHNSPAKVCPPAP
jgi:hypothetical protein